MYAAASGNRTRLNTSAFTPFRCTEYTNAATSAVIAAITRKTGFVRNVRFMADIAVFTMLMAFTTFGMTVRIVPTVLMTLPMTSSAGPIAATIKPILMIVSFISGDREFNLSAKA